MDCQSSQAQCMRPNLNKKSSPLPRTPAFHSPHPLILTEPSFATITILAYDRVNMLGEIAFIIGENGVSIRAASIQSDDKTRISTLRLTLDVHSREEMDRVIQALRNKSDILDVYRATK